MGLNRAEWNGIFKFILKSIKFLISSISKLKAVNRLTVGKTAIQRSFSSSDNNSRNLEPKIDFESLKYQPVSTS